MQAEDEAHNSGNNERSKVLVPMYSDMYVFRYVCIQLGIFSDMSKSRWEYEKVYVCQHISYWCVLA